MNQLQKPRSRVVPWLISATMLGFGAPALAEPEAVTQFAPLDDTPIPTPPTAAEPNATTRVAPTAVPDAFPPPTSSGNTPPHPANATNVNPVPAYTSVTPTTTNSPASPTVGSSWLGATTTLDAAPATVAAPASEMTSAPSVIDSGLPAFVQPSPSPAGDVVTPDDAAADDEETHRLALTFSLARAFLLPAVVPGEVKNAALYEGSAEVKVFERLSLAVIAGFGVFDVPLSQVDENVHVTGKELGGQARVYVFGNFDHGLSIGGEYLRVWAQADPIDVKAVPPPPFPAGTGVLTGEATLSGLGGFIGYKFTAGFGLTFDAKLGIQKLTAEGKGTVSGEIGPGYPTLTESETFRYDQLVPLVNVNVGWAI